ncbi:unnamed protein product [Closterium sp. NIES-64]|nr:unnamed protein product [Closterium sp. NIES-64]
MPARNDYHCTDSVKTPNINKRGQVGHVHGSELMGEGTPVRTYVAPSPVVTIDAVKAEAGGGPGMASAAAAPGVAVIAQLLLQVLGGAGSLVEAAVPGFNTREQGGAAAELIAVMQRLRSATTQVEASMGRERTTPTTTTTGKKNTAASPKSSRISDVVDAETPAPIAAEGRSLCRGGKAKGASSGEHTVARGGKLTKGLNYGLCKNPLEHDNMVEERLCRVYVFYLAVPLQDDDGLLAPQVPRTWSDLLAEQHHAPLRFDSGHSLIFLRGVTSPPSRMFNGEVDSAKQGGTEQNPSSCNQDAGRVVSAFTANLAGPFPEQP